MEKQQGKLQGSGHKLLLQGFTEWLEVLGYSALGIPTLSSTVQRFLSHQEQNGKTALQQLEASDATRFIEGLKSSIGERTKRPFTGNYLNKQVQGLNLFSRYIRETGKSNVGFSLQLSEQEKNKPVWLTKAEVQRLYGATEIPPLGGGGAVLGIRDRAMLAVFYGCGLRLNEGASLELKDIDHTRKLLHVRKGKGYKERFVPIAEKNHEEIKLYTDYARPQLLQETKTAALFIGANKGVKMDKQSLYIRIKKLVKKAGLAAPPGDRGIGTHTLRHSIATHLLQSGMKLERIRDFLGHAGLDSTQVYTHLLSDKL